MAKLLGVGEMVDGVGRLPAMMLDAQRVSLMGLNNYEHPERVEQEFTPYQKYAVSLGAANPYDLSAPGNVAEIKRVLIALAKHASDPFTPGDTAKETLWKYINQSHDYADAWDGPTADEFVAAVGRYRDKGLMPGLPWKTWGPYVQLPTFPVKMNPGQVTLNGGPQPTVNGLELLAQASREYLHGSVQLDNYLAWRGGVLECTEFTPASCKPPSDGIVSPAVIQGPPWNPRGWTVAWRNGPAAKANPELIEALDVIDGGLKKGWIALQNAKNETQRTSIADSILSARYGRNKLVHIINAGAPIPACKEAFVWNKQKGRCVEQCPGDATVYSPETKTCIVAAPPVHITGGWKSLQECIAAYKKAYPDQSDDDISELCSKEVTVDSAGIGTVGWIVLGGAVAAGLYLWKKKRKTGARG